MDKNQKLRDAIIEQKSLIRYLESRIQLAEHLQTQAKEKLQQDPTNLYWGNVEHECKMKIGDVQYCLELANKALKLVEEGIAEMEAPEQ